MNAVEVAAYQDNVIRVARDRWLKRWRNPIVVWGMRLSVWVMWGSGVILWYSSIMHRESLAGIVILLISMIAGPRFALRELRGQKK